ncbi:MAG TPA: serine hydrolase domain-containing protein, partial [Acetobacteraceae bacterium]|nr:serine hydrolase domain-containing protein [Acetobacteraceae bacterium]
ERLSTAMRGYVDRGELAGAVTLLSRHDEVHVAAVGMQDLADGTPMQRDTIFRIASMTKPMTAAAAMILVEEAKLRLDEPVDRLLPELSDRRVLRAIDGPLDDTVPANRAITLRDLLTFRLGLGAVMAPPGRYPIQQAITEAGLAPGPNPPPFTPDEFLRRFATLPLIHQPGDQWMYHTGSDVLGVLIARAAGMKLADFLQQRLFALFGMNDTGFSVPEPKLDRLATAYQVDTGTGRLAVYDEARGGQWSHPPAFQSAGGGLVSTADDCLAFARMLLRRGRHGADRVLARPTVALMMTDQLSQQQKAASPFFPGFWDTNGWGFGGSVVTRRSNLGPSIGSYGWIGGFSTGCYSDPQEDMVAILLTQRVMSRPAPENFFTDFWTLAYQAIDD